MFRKITYNEARFLVNFIDKRVEEEGYILGFDLLKNKFNVLTPNEVAELNMDWESALSRISIVFTPEELWQVKQLLSNSDKKSMIVRLYNEVNDRATMPTIYQATIPELDSYLKKVKNTDLILRVKLVGTKKFYDYFVYKEKIGLELLKVLNNIEAEQGKKLEFYINEVK